MIFNFYINENLYHNIFFLSFKKAKTSTGIPLSTEETISSTKYPANSFPFHHCDQLEHSRQ